jgi:uncharacterized protein YeaO (DUF488 family)
VIHVVRLGPGPGLRLGTVRRPPRGVRKSDWGRYFDLWLPLLAPSAPLVKYALGGGNYDRYARRYVSEMKRREPSEVLDLLAALSHSTDFSVGCYCEDESRCHRTLVRELLRQRGARIDEPRLQQRQRLGSRHGSPARARRRQRGHRSQLR